MEITHLQMSDGQWANIENQSKYLLAYILWTTRYVTVYF